MGKIIGILSLKGGVGKTSSTISLGSSLSSFGKKVLLVDCNFSAPNLGIHLNILNPKKTIHSALDGSFSVNESIHKFESFDLIPASLYPLTKINPFRLKEILKPLRNDYDFIILDSSPSLNQETLSVILASDELIVVTTPDYPTLSTTIKAIKLAKSKGTPIMGMIINKSYGKNFELSLSEIERTAEVPIMAVIPHDSDFVKSLYIFTPYVINKPKSKGTIEYKKLAGVLIGKKYSEPFNWINIFRKITPEPQEVNREVYYESVFGQ